MHRIVDFQFTNQEGFELARVTIRPAFFIANPAFGFSQTEQFDHRCSNFNIGQAGHHDMWSDLQKKKKKVNTCLAAGFVQFSA